MSAGIGGAQRVCALAELVSETATRFDVDGVAVAVVRIGDDVFAIGDRCSHANFSLSEGEVDSAACTLECWKHGAAFSLRTGEPQTLPANKPVAVYDVDLRDGDVYLSVRHRSST
ncbi:MAG: non-heme iron oxygenase ferredoxin subunit [Actinomycetota bacterium]|nr:non-heme iron oxygenase ferredoxin subunit [Actinomycetota bacterium]